jgi:hypothetical protein
MGSEISNLSKADIHLKNTNGDTALSIARKLEHTTMVSLFNQYLLVSLILRRNTNTDNRRGEARNRNHGCAGSLRLRFSEGDLKLEDKQQEHSWKPVPFAGEAPRRRPGTNVR